MKGKSLLNTVSSDVTKLLLESGFQESSEFINGVLCLIDSFSSYHEEGVELYPEVVIFLNKTDESIFKYISGEKTVLIHKDKDLNVRNFKKTIKSLAPLNQDGWISFFAVHEDYKSFSSGTITAEENEISLPIQSQLLSFGKDFSIPFVIISCLGGKNVLLRGSNGNDLLISFTLKYETKILEFNLMNLIKVLYSKKNKDETQMFHLYTSSLLQKSFRKGHGNLIGIIDDNQEALQKVKQVLHGIYLLEPIDFFEKVSNTYNLKNLECNYDLKQYTSLLSNILNFDGITLFTNNFKLIGYNLFIDSDVEEVEDGGGARTRAYLAMIKSNCFEACFFKSQDGNEKIHIK